MGSRIFGLLTLAVGGVILADAFVHRKGLKVAGNTFNKGLTHTYDALLGQAP